MPKHRQFVKDDLVTFGHEQFGVVTSVDYAAQLAYVETRGIHTARFVQDLTLVVQGDAEYTNAVYALEAPFWKD